MEEKGKINRNGRVKHKKWAKLKAKKAYTDYGAIFMRSKYCCISGG
jgi:hypothetical protein